MAAICQLIEVLTIKPVKRYASTVAWIKLTFEVIRSAVMAQKFRLIVASLLGSEVFAIQGIRYLKVWYAASENNFELIDHVLCKCAF